MNQQIKRVLTEVLLKVTSAFRTVLRLSLSLHSDFPKFVEAISAVEIFLGYS